ncbi:MlrC [Rhodovulum sp. P5]|uniref:M81 family metallopeptidase n=1 Tax=Rhodovulum sp. P5 TaxID=1564506 RepID=UPI0009C21695|nr:M81 family metallopeptidase [Rhodovulum sp. P5]ARE42238.1 MlrC [Rhodovulum sp. P5]
MTRIAVAGFQHETNTFAPQPTTWDLFEKRGAWPELTRGADLIDRFRGLNIPLSGFMAECRHDLVPLLWAGAEPGGYVAADAFDRIVGEIVAGVQAAAPDALYLDLHGAMVTRDAPDAEAEILARIRRAMGPDFPIAVSLDLHGNLSPAFFDAATVVTVYRTYPHTDMAETGARAARLLDAAMTRPVAKAFRQGGALIPITAQSTEFSPGAELYAALPGRDALSVDLASGFPPADIPDCGPSIFAYAETQEAADRAADETLAHLNAVEGAFDDRLLSAPDAVARAMAGPGPVVIADVQDNPGAGGTGETTGLLRALVEAQAPDAILSMLFDPAAAAAAHQAGLGAEIILPLGGHYTQYSQPLTAEVIVETLSDGRFRCTGPMFGGSDADMGPTACLRLKGTGIRVVVGSARAQNADQEFFRVVGLEPAEHAIVCVKSAIHFMADYKRIAPTILFAETPGANPCNLAAIPFTRLRSGIRLGPGGPMRG